LSSPTSASPTQVKTGDQTIYTTAYHNLVLPLKDLVRRRSSLRQLRILRRTQFLSAEDIRRLQDKRLRRLIEHGVRAVPYYHKLFRRLGLSPEDVSSIRDLAKIPPLSRGEIKQHFYQLQATDYPRQRIRLDASSGSTGEPIRFLKTIEQRSWELAAELRAYEWFGVRKGERHALLFPEARRSRVPIRLRVYLDRVASRCRFFNGINLSEDRMTAFAHELIGFRPSYLIGSPGVLSVFARHIQREDIPLRVETVITSFEKLYPHQRKTIEETLEASVRDFYGSRELGSIAAECPHQRTYVCSAENLHLEVVDESGEPCSPGETGEILITGLLNYAMPLIRYRIGDMATLSSQQCDNRGLPTLQSIQGRSIGMLVSSEGHLVSTIFIVDSLPVSRFQVVQESNLDVTVRLVPEKTYDRRHERRIESAVRRRLGEVKVSIEHVREIPGAKSGKHRYVYSKAAQRLLSDSH
jgi:phenylacetate-CoA ligase